MHEVNNLPPRRACYDGKTIYGSWAFMCQECFTKYGVGLGTGRGRRLVLKDGVSLGEVMEENKRLDIAARQRELPLEVLPEVLGELKAEQGVRVSGNLVERFRSVLKPPHQES
jgi:hypothetical protein